MSKDLSVSILLDIYGDMLTEKQKEVIELYYNEDLSLGEISELSGITRQGVRDSIKRGEAFLMEMEDKLHFAQKQKEMAELLGKIKEMAEQMAEHNKRFCFSREIAQMAAQVYNAAEKLEEDVL
ncbi:YlxM family DNA-binding protein [Zongyangia hominis]|uniref:UPF0122 protein H8709_04710 n=1 Tax=Zongyangia hominis TaxID=2763677 RepID=A0A926EDH8_9FIRM|nr:sigma factor-like helix-turn-helix DNA-binding protein [Zongyangia hominis]MBC8570126.1 DNA-binding protein [Zongyangia hominis]